jgi:hypothetical protein
MIKNNLKMKIKQTVLVHLVLFFICSVSWAATYYVDDTDGSDSYTGSNPDFQGGSVGPWRTIGKCASTLKAGDTCNVQAGSYNESVTETTSGQNGSPITYEGNNQNAVIRGRFKVEGDYVNINGFELDNGYIKLSQASYCKITNNYVHDVDYEGIRLSTSPEYRDNNTCANNTIKGNTIADADDAGIQIAGQNHTVENNDISHIAPDGDGMRFFGKGHLIKGNYIHDLYHPSGSDPHVDCFQTWEYAHDIIFEGNICENSETGGSNQITMIEDMASTPTVYNLTFRNNIFIMSDSGYAPMAIYEKDPGEYIDNITVVNNTFYCRGDNCDEAIYFKDVRYANIKNNIFYGWGKSYKCYFVALGTRTGWDYDHNLIYNSDRTQGCEAEANDIWMQNPNFVNLSNLDFRLQSNSPAINAGYNSGVKDDHDGVARPQGGAYDIGAFEYHDGDGSGYNEIPSPPMNLRVIN